MKPSHLTLLTDLYELTMMQGYFKNKDRNEMVIFDAFYRADPARNEKVSGSGLGLAIVKHIVARHDATMTLESDKGKGTEITIYFNVFDADTLKKKIFLRLLEIRVMFTSIYSMEVYLNILQNENLKVLLKVLRKHHKKILIERI